MGENSHIRSMTGYGQASADLGEARLTVELRTVNHRYADLRLRLPHELAALERDIRRKVSARVKRGRIELSVNVESPTGGPDAPQLNRALATEVIAAAKTLNEEFGVEGSPDLPALLGVPGMFRTGPIVLEWDEAQREALDRSLDVALEALERERCREGQHVGQELSRRVRDMVRIAAEIRESAAVIPAATRDRLCERLKSLDADVEVDPARLAQEALLLADRSDVTEEMVRLEGHLDQMLSLIEKPDGEPVGKRLDFLLQEVNRETNTINSKSADLELSRKALALKAEVEKVREQVQNLE